MYARRMRAALVLGVALAVAATATAGKPPDPRQARVVATGPAPCGIAARSGSIWVAVYETGVLLSIDDSSGRIEARRRVGRLACRVAVGPAAVWVTRDRPGELVRVSRGSGRLERLRVGAGAFDVRIVFASVWTTSYDTGAIVRTDPSTRRLVRVYRDGPNPAGIASCRGRLWVGHGPDATWLTAIDPVTNELRRVDVGTTNPSWPTCIRGTLWVTASDTLLKVSARTGEVLARARLGGTLAGAAEGPDALVWVTDKERSLVHRIYAGDATVTDTFEAGAGAFALARAGESMWITSFAGSDVRRFDP